MAPKKKQVIRKIISLVPISIFISIIAILFSPQSFANVQTFGPVSFEMPVGWSCQVRDNNLICLDQSPTSEKNAAIVLNYKYRTAEDVLAVYRDQLSRPRTLYDGDQVKPSVPQGVRDVLLNGITWIEGIHLGSEMEDYYTLYYVTVVEPYAILMSISVERAAYQSKLPFLKSTIKSIKVNPKVAEPGYAHNPNFKNANQHAKAQGMVNENRLQNKKISWLTWSVLGLGFVAVSALLVYAIKS